MTTEPSFAVRRATVDDANAFAEQRRALFLEIQTIAPGERERALDLQTRAAFADLVVREKCLVWLAFGERGDVAGSVTLQLVERLPSPQNPRPVEGYLGHLFVTPAWRRRGVGSELVRAALDEARARNLGRVRLHATDAGRAVYERLAFQPRTNEMERFV